MNPSFTGGPYSVQPVVSCARHGRLVPWAMGLVLLAIMSFTTPGQAASIAEIVNSPERWPSEIKLAVATKAILLRDGQPSGAVLLGAGRTLSVTAIAAREITGRVGGMIVRVPTENTDLAARVAALPVDPVVPASPTPHQAPSPAVAHAGPPVSKENPTTLQRLLLGHLVELHDGRLQPFDQRRLNGVKFYGIMFSAGWCGPCREFAPHLLDSYRRLKDMYPEFELVLVSNDHSPGDMLSYMKDEKMPWPAFKFGEAHVVDEIARLAGPGIPCLVLVDEEGKVIADSFKGSSYLGPDSVLDATWRTLQRHRRELAGR